MWHAECFFNGLIGLCEYANLFSLKIPFSSIDSLYRPYKKEIQIKVVLFSTSVKMILCDHQFTCAFFL